MTWRSGYAIAATAAITMLLASAISAANAFAGTTNEASALGGALVSTADAVGGVAGLLVAAILFTIELVAARFGSLDFLVRAIVRRALFLESTTAILTLVAIDLGVGLFLQVGNGDVGAIAFAAIAANVVAGPAAVLLTLDLIRRVMNLIGHGLRSPALLSPLRAAYATERERRNATTFDASAFDVAIAAAGLKANVYVDAFAGTAVIGSTFTLSTGHDGPVTAIHPHRLATVRRAIESRFGDRARITLSAAAGHSFGPPRLVVRVPRPAAVPGEDDADRREWSRAFARSIRVGRQVSAPEPSMLDELLSRLVDVARAEPTDRLRDALAVAEALIADDAAAGIEDPVPVFSDANRGFYDTVLYAATQAETDKLDAIISFVVRTAHLAANRGLKDLHEWSLTHLQIAHARAIANPSQRDWARREFDDSIGELSLTLPMTAGRNGVNPSSANAEAASIERGWLRLVTRLVLRASGPSHDIAAVERFTARLVGRVEHRDWHASGLSDDERAVLRAEVIAISALVGRLLSVANGPPEDARQLSECAARLIACLPSRDLVADAWQMEPMTRVGAGVLGDVDDIDRTEPRPTLEAYAPAHPTWPHDGLVVSLLCVQQSLSDQTGQPPLNLGESISMEDIAPAVARLFGEPGDPRRIALFPGENPDCRIEDAIDSLRRDLTRRAAWAAAEFVRADCETPLDPVAQADFATSVATEAATTTADTLETLCRNTTPGDAGSELFWTDDLPRSILFASNAGHAAEAGATSALAWRTLCAEAALDALRAEAPSEPTEEMAFGTACRDAIASLRRAGRTPDAAFVYGGQEVVDLLSQGELRRDGPRWQEPGYQGQVDGVAVFACRLRGSGRGAILIDSASALSRSPPVATVEWPIENHPALAQAIVAARVAALRGEIPARISARITFRVVGANPLSIANANAARVIALPAYATTQSRRHNVVRRR